MKLRALINTLETNIDRSDDDSWTALCLQVPEANDLLREMIALLAACESVRQYPGVVEYVGTWRAKQTETLDKIWGLAPEVD